MTFDLTTQHVVKNINVSSTLNYIQIQLLIQINSFGAYLNGFSFGLNDISTQKKNIFLSV